MHNLGIALLDDRQLKEAQEIMSRVFEERKRKLGKEHPWTLWALCDLAKVKLELGHLQEAEEMLVPGIEAAKRSLSEEHLGVLMGEGALARVIARQGDARYEEAENLTRKIVEKLEKSRGLEHPDTVYALWKLARLLELQNKIEEAAKVCELALQRVHMRLTAQHPLGAKIQSHLPTLKSRLVGQQNN
jgi:tetratricopeptide (TPR) repeat protein